MSSSGYANADAAGRSLECPPVDYVCQFDDDDNPSELTISDPNALDVTTGWLTIDAVHAVSLDEWR